MTQTVINLKYIYDDFDYNRHRSWSGVMFQLQAHSVCETQEELGIF